MNESGITSQLTKFLRESVPGEVIKHADRATIGVPDISVTTGGKTSWIEIKLIHLEIEGGRDPQTAISQAILKNKRQHEMMRKLHTHGDAFYVVFIMRSNPAGSVHWQTGIANPFEWEKNMRFFDGKRFIKIKEHIDATREQLPNARPGFSRA